MWEIGLRITWQSSCATMLNAVLGNENKQHFNTWFCILARTFPSKWLSLSIGEGERQGTRNWKPLWQREGRDWLGWEGRSFLIPVALSVENFFLSPLLALPISINSFCVCLSCAEGSQTGRMPSLIGMCHRAEGKSNQWSFLTPTLLPALINTFICILSLWLWLLPLLSPFLLESH